MAALAAPDPALFDPRRLEGEIRRGAAPVAAYREALALGREHLKQGFDMGVGIDALVAQRAWLIDQILLSAWREAGLDPGRFALLAVGGYGRGELHPGSDVDVAIVTGTETLDEEHQRIAGYVRFLWDIGLDIGHSVRTVEHCEALLAMRGDNGAVRVSYLEGELELMAPSIDHKNLKTRLARLLEAYRGLGVPEVWLRQEGGLSFYLLDEGGYTVGPRSTRLPDLDPELLTHCMAEPRTQTAAVRAYRQALRAAAPGGV